MKRIHEFHLGTPGTTQYLVRAPHDAQFVDVYMDAWGNGRLVYVADDENMMADHTIFVMGASDFPGEAAVHIGGMTMPTTGMRLQFFALPPRNVGKPKGYDAISWEP